MPSQQAPSPRAPTPAPVTGTCRLILTITVETDGHPNTTCYSLLKLDPHPQVGHPAWRLTKETSEHYDVILTPHGAECSCADWTYRRNHKDALGCKHVRALRAVGLLKE